MARPLRSGLDYFPLDVDFQQDERIRLLSEERGNVGVFAYLALLAATFRVGMCFRWDAIAKRSFALSLKLSIGEVDTLLETMLELGLFDRGTLERTGFLTSRAIQRRYVAACDAASRKGARVPIGVLLLELSDLPGDFRVEEKERSKEREEERILKESKVKETPRNPQLTPINGGINPQETPSKSLTPRTDLDGFRRVGDFTGLNPISYEQLSCTEGCEVVDRALLLVEGWVRDSKHTAAHDYEKRKQRAADCSGALASFALSKAREQISKEASAKGRGKKTMEEKLRAIAAL